MNNPLKQYSFRFQLQCCGLISGYDISDFTTITRGSYPITCCRRTLYDTTNDQIDHSSEITGQYCNLIQTVRFCRNVVHIKYNNVNALKNNHKHV